MKQNVFLKLLTTVLVTLLGLTLSSSDGWSHGLDPNRALVHLAGDTAYVKAIIPAVAFAECDSNANARLERREINACRTQLLSAIDGVLVLTNEDGHAGERVFSDVNTPHSHSNSYDASAYLRLTLRYRWPKAPKALAVRYARTDLGALNILATRLTLERQRAKQRPTGPTVTATLSVQYPHHVFWGDGTKHTEVQGPENPIPPT